MPSGFATCRPQGKPTAPKQGTQTPRKAVTRRLKLKLHRQMLLSLTPEGNVFEFIDDRATMPITVTKVSLKSY